MSDYNDGLLPEPCLRMDTHFGDEYESVEFGDGTGYVKAAPMLARLGALHVGLDELLDENAKLREYARKLLTGYECGRGELCEGCSWNGWDGDCNARMKARELGVEVE